VRRKRGFDGKLNRAKCAKISKCSDDTALRDLTDLVERGILAQVGIGRGTSYELVRLMHR
jgi:Fic family protein